MNVTHYVYVVDQEVKVSSPDYLTTDKDHAVEDFKRRIAVYEQQYNTLDEELDKNLSFIKIYNQGERYLVNNIHGMKLSLAYWCTAYLFFCILNVIMKFHHCDYSYEMYCRSSS